MHNRIFVLLVLSYLGILLVHLYGLGIYSTEVSFVFVVFSTIVVMFSGYEPSVAERRFLVNQQAILLFTIMSLILYGILYGYPVLDGSWYSSTELNETTAKKIYKGMLLWFPLMIWMINKKNYLPSFFSLLFSLLIANRTYPIIYCVLFFSCIKGVRKKIVVIIVSSLMLLSITAIKHGDSQPSDAIQNVVDRIFQVEFEGLDFFLVNKDSIDNAYSDELYRYISDKKPLLITQKIAAMQRGLHPDEYTNEMGAPTVSSFALFYYFIPDPNAAFVIFLIAMGLIIYLLIFKISDPRMQIIAWMVVLYSMRNGVILPVVFGVLIDMLPAYILSNLLSYNENRTSLHIKKSF